MMGFNCLGGYGFFVELFNWIGDYFVKWIKKMVIEDIKYVYFKKKVVEVFIKIIGEIYKSFVWIGVCSSWYKCGMVDGRVIVLFGGSVYFF